MVALVERMLSLHQQLAVAKTPPAKTMLQRQIAATDQASATRWPELPELTTVNAVDTVKPGATTLLSATGDGRQERGRADAWRAAAGPVGEGAGRRGGGDAQQRAQGQHPARHGSHTHAHAADGQAPGPPLIEVEADGRHQDAAAHKKDGKVKARRQQDAGLRMSQGEELAEREPQAGRLRTGRGPFRPGLGQGHGRHGQSHGAQPGAGSHSGLKPQGIGQGTAHEGAEGQAQQIEHLVEAGQAPPILAAAAVEDHGIAADVDQRPGAAPEQARGQHRPETADQAIGPVSYTHLTLPTIYSV